MRVFFIILMVALAGFIIWCAKTQQPKETSCINLMSLMIAYELFRTQKKGS